MAITVQPLVRLLKFVPQENIQMSLHKLCVRYAVPVLTPFSALESVTHVLQATTAKVQQTEYPENVHLEHFQLQVRQFVQCVPMDITAQLVSAS